MERRRSVNKQTLTKSKWRSLSDLFSASFEQEHDEVFLISQITTSICLQYPTVKEGKMTVFACIASLFRFTGRVQQGQLFPSFLMVQHVDYSV